MIDKRLHRDTAANLVGTLVPVAITLATVPPYLRLIGEERFGVLAIASVLLGYFGLFEVGTGEASARYIAAHSVSSPQQREAVFWTVFTINAALGTTAGILLWAVGRHLLAMFHMSDQMRSEILPALPWLGAAIPIVTTITVLAGALDGRQQFVTSNLLRVLGDCTFQIVPLAVAFYHGPHLTWLLASAVLARALAVPIFFFGCWKHVPLSAPGILDRRCIREVLFFGGWATISGLLYPLLKTIDQFVIAVLRGASAVTYYTIPYQFAMKLTIVPNSIVRSLFPRMAMRSRSSGIELAQGSLLGIVALTTPIAVASIIGLSPFLLWWLGPSIARSSSVVGELLIIGAWLTGFIALSGKLLIAQGRPDLVAKVHLAEIVPFGAVLWLAVKAGGIQGAALVWVLRSAIEALLLFWLAALSWKRLSSLLAPVALLLTALLCARAAAENTILQAVLGGILIAITVMWALRQSPTINQTLKDFVAPALAWRSYVRVRPAPAVVVLKQEPSLNQHRSGDTSVMSPADQPVCSSRVRPQRLPFDSTSKVKGHAQ